MSATSGYPIASATSVGMVSAPAPFAVSAGGALGLTAVLPAAQQATLGADVAMNAINTTFAGPSLNLAAGKWLISGIACVATGATPGLLIVQLLNGASVIAEVHLQEAVATGQNAVPIALVLTLASAATITLAAQANSATHTLIHTYNTGPGCVLTALSVN